MVSVWHWYNPGYGVYFTALRVPPTCARSWVPLVSALRSQCKEAFAVVAGCFAFASLSYHMCAVCDALSGAQQVQRLQCSSPILEDRRDPQKLQALSLGPLCYAVQLLRLPTLNTDQVSHQNEIKRSKQQNQLLYCSLHVKHSRKQHGE